MDEIKKLILQLDEQDCRWREYIKASDDSKINDAARFRQTIVKLLLELRNILKLDDQSKADEAARLIDDKEIADSFFKHANNTLVNYRAMSHIRLLEKEDFALCKDFFDTVMSNYVVRWNMELHKEFERYHFNDRDEMQESMASLDALADYYVGKALTHKSIVKDFAEETDLSETICNYYADILDKYYMDIKLNIILNKIESLSERMERVERDK